MQQGRGVTSMSVMRHQIRYRWVRSARVDVRAKENLLIREEGRAEFGLVTRVERQSGLPESSNKISETARLPGRGERTGIDGSLR